MSRMITKKSLIIAAGAVFIEKSKVLLLIEKNHTHWSFPGGKVEFNNIKNWHQILEDTAKREIMEEINSEMTIIKYLKPMLIPQLNKKSGNLVVLIHYLAKKKNKLIILGDEIEQYKWFSLNKLPKNCMPNIKPVLNSIKKI